MNASQYETLAKKWFRINLSLVLFLFYFSVMSGIIFALVDAGEYLEDSLLWFGNGIYLGIWFLIVYRWGLKKKGEVCTLIHFIMLGLNLLAMIAIMIREMIDYVQLIFSMNIRTVYLFILTQHYISFAILIIIFLCAAEAGWQLYKANKLSSYRSSV